MINKKLITNTYNSKSTTVAVSNQVTDRGTHPTIRSTSPKKAYEKAKLLIENQKQNQAMQYQKDL